jgi:AcrR family transcriptional regulator
MPSPPRQTPANQRAPAQPPPPAKTPRGDAVIARVLVAARALLVRQPSRAVSLVEVAKKAKVPRASLLLQFPHGMADIIGRLIYEEYLAAFESTEPVDLLSASLAFMTLGGHEPGHAAALLPLQRLVDRSLDNGLLFRNLQSEALQFTGSHLEEHRGRLAMMGVSLLMRLDNSADAVISLQAIHLAESIVRLTWDLAAGSWDEGRDGTPHPVSRTDVLRDAFRVIAPELASRLAAGRDPAAAEAHADGPMKGQRDVHEERRPGGPADHPAKGGYAHRQGQRKGLRSSGPAASRRRT